jgi:hypothetical protein
MQILGSKCQAAAGVAAAASKRYGSWLTMPSVNSNLPKKPMPAPSLRSSSNYSSSSFCSAASTLSSGVRGASTACRKARVSGVAIWALLCQARSLKSPLNETWAPRRSPWEHKKFERPQQDLRQVPGRLKKTQVGTLKFSAAAVVECAGWPVVDRAKVSASHFRL